MQRKSAERADQVQADDDVMRGSSVAHGFEFTLRIHNKHGKWQSTLSALKGQN